jgi:acetoin utilization protein AcuC
VNGGGQRTGQAQGRRELAMVREGTVPVIPAKQKATFVGASCYRRAMYGSNHPLAIPRVSLAYDLIGAFGAIGEQ